MKFNIFFVMGVIYLASISAMIAGGIGTYHDAFVTEPIDPFFALFVYGVPFVLGYYAKVEEPKEPFRLEYHD